MANKTDIIELNGKRYNAVTGTLLAEQGSHTPKTPASHATKTIDGVVKTPHRPGSPAPHHAPHPSHAATTPAHAPKKAFDVHRTPAPHHVSRHPQPAKTLMRHAVQRPHGSLKRHAKTTSHTAALVKPPRVSVVPKYSFQDINRERLKRAQRIARSGLISRFGNLDLIPRPRSESPQAVPPRPQATATRPTATFSRQITPTPRTQPSTAIFEQALAHANSHKQPAPARAKKSHRLRHAASLAASSLVILLIIGFIAYQNAANIQMRLASSKAGISATMPKWQPAGFSPVKFTYAPGTVVIAFKNDHSSSDFSLTQSVSNWDSSALLSDFVIAQSNSYNAVEADGRTIYTYGNNNATWVDGGIWYKLTTNGALSTTQLIHLASST